MKKSEILRAAMHKLWWPASKDDLSYLTSKPVSTALAVEQAAKQYAEWYRQLRDAAGFNAESLTLTLHGIPVSSEERQGIRIMFLELMALYLEDQGE